MSRRFYPVHRSWSTANVYVDIVRFYWISYLKLPVSFIRFWHLNVEIEWKSSGIRIDTEINAGSLVIRRNPHRTLDCSSNSVDSRWTIEAREFNWISRKVGRRVPASMGTNATGWKRRKFRDKSCPYEPQGQIDSKIARFRPVKKLSQSWRGSNGGQMVLFPWVDHRLHLVPDLFALMRVTHEACYQETSDLSCSFVSLSSAKLSLRKGTWPTVCRVSPR